MTLGSNKLTVDQWQRMGGRQMRHAFEKGCSGREAVIAKAVQFMSNQILPGGHRLGVC